MDTVLGMKLKTLVAFVAVIVFLSFAGIYYITMPSTRATFRKVHIVQLPKKVHHVDGMKQVDEEISGHRVFQGYTGRRLPSPNRPERLQKLLGDGMLPEYTIFEINKFPEDPRLWPSIGNGHVATVVHSGVMYMNGLYNGRLSDSHRAKLPTLISMDIVIAAPLQHQVKQIFSLDIGTGIYSETTTGSFFTIEKLLFAHRRIKELFAVEVKVKIRDHPTRQPLILKLLVKTKPESEDIDFVKKKCDIASLHCSYIHGKIKQAEIEKTDPSEVHVYYTDVPDNITMMDGMMEEMSQLYLMAVSHSENTARRTFEDGLRMNQRLPLKSSHMGAWIGLWNEGRIEMDGRKELAELNFDPHGHVSSDQERWLFPPLLMLHSNMSRLLLDYRVHRLDMAKRIALSRHLQGALYPAQSAHSGVEVSADTSLELDQLRTTGNIALALQQYTWMTKDSPYLSDSRVLGMVTSIADLWESRIRYDTEKKQYGVVGLAPSGGEQATINNSVYINSIGKTSLLLPSQILPVKSVDKYRALADGMYIPFDKELKYHPQFDGYKSGSELTHADVLLLGFPISENIPPDVRTHDLETYEKVSRSASHSLLWSPFAIGWLELNDVEKAEKFLNKSIEYTRGPFKVWQEYRDGRGMASYNSAMAAYLQTILFGYGGFRIQDKSVLFNPVLPTSVTRFVIRNLDYLGQSLTFTIDAKSTQVTLKPSTTKVVPLVVMEFESHKTHILKADTPVVIKAGTKASVLVKSL